MSVENQASSAARLVGSTAAPRCALLELARAAPPGRCSMSCLRSVPVCVVATVVVYVKERDTHTRRPDNTRARFRTLHSARKKHEGDRTLHQQGRMDPPASRGVLNELACGAFGGLVAALATHPIDTLPTLAFMSNQYYLFQLGVR